VAISALGYYPNPLDANPEHRRFVINHLQKVITAAPLLNVRLVNTFIGRDPARSLEANWPLFREIWPDIVHHAEREGVNLGIENCPMLFGTDEWPGGKNLAVSPAVWQAILTEIPSPHLGLNFDPSHLVWQHIDYVRCVRDFGSKIVHVHAKDTRIDHDRLYAVGIQGLGWHTAKLPGLGDVNWGALFSALTDAGYAGPVCIEVEDRAFEGSLENRKRALRQSKRFLEQFVS
jgi:sugar phosphate isomerase/epimerase